MKKKIISYSFITVICIGCIVQYARHRDPVTSLNHSNSEATEEVMIAPAIIDALNDITRVPTLQSGLINAIYVKVGQKVKKGQILFSLDSTGAERNVQINKIALEQSKNALLIQEKALKFVKNQLKRFKSLDKRAISRADLQGKIHEFNMNILQTTQAKHNLTMAEANLKNAELTLSQFSTVAPKDGIVLQINAHLNEFVGGSQQIIFLGDAKKIIVRVSLDERDAHRFHPSDPTYLTSHENASLNIPLTFIQLDRYIITQERLNSRVQEALYSFNRDSYPNLTAGELFEAHISLSATS